MKKIFFLTVAYLFILLLPQTVFGQYKFTYVRTPAEIIKLAKLKAAIEAVPDDLKAHEAFTRAVGPEDPMLEKQYKLWITQFPKSAIIPFAIGKYYCIHNDSRSKEYLLKAITINPNLAEAWKYLASISSLNGDRIAALSYIKEAKKIDTTNVDYYILYVRLMDKDPVKHDSLMVDFVKRFPENNFSAEALSTLADRAVNFDEKTTYYEQLYKGYANQQRGWWRVGMGRYFDYLLKTSPDKAAELASKMVIYVKTNLSEWKRKLEVANKFVEARKAIAANDPAKAEETLKQVYLGNSSTDDFIDATETLSLFKAEVADANHQTKAAYDTLVKFYSKKPSDGLHAAIVTYGAKLGLDSDEVSGAIWKLRDSTASKKIYFTFKNYQDQKDVSLLDFKGKVVLLTYWFPSCGPCRIEFPHFEAVLKKLNSKDVVYLAVNISRQEDKNVLPLIKSEGYSFIPLFDDGHAKRDIPPVNVAPSNFLIDPKGRIVFSDFRIDQTNESTLELMITELLRFKNLSEKKPVIDSVKKDTLVKNKLSDSLNTP